MLYGISFAHFCNSLTPVSGARIAVPPEFLPLCYHKGCIYTLCITKTEGNEGVLFIQALQVFLFVDRSLFSFCIVESAGL